MHAKVCVCDDTVFIGSFNLSHSGEENAENVLEIEDASLAERMASYIDAIRAKYPPLALDELARVGQRRQHRLNPLSKVLVRRGK
jgi:phosphatidylserine/phosphatidylglycerophosphate/cardiolipin synthase-like enzyme